MVKPIRKPCQTIFTKELRHRQTDAERKIWNILRNLQIEGVKFRRQHVIGNYIVDFISLSAKLMIEIDGGQHNEDTNIRKDEQRTIWWEKEGYKVIRFWDNDVLMNTDGVFSVILDTLKGKITHHPHPAFSPRGRRET